MTSQEMEFYAVMSPSERVVFLSTYAALAAKDPDMPVSEWVELSVYAVEAYRAFINEAEFADDREWAVNQLSERR